MSSVIQTQGAGARAETGAEGVGIKGVLEQGTWMYRSGAELESAGGDR